MRNLKGAIAAFLAVLVFFLALECLVRLYKTAKASIIISPKISFKLDTSYLKYGFEYIFLQGERSSAKNEACNYLIKAYGGSTTYGFGVEKEESYPSQLQVILKEHFRADKISVSNQGICAGASDKAVENMLSGLRADTLAGDHKTIFIFYEGINDAIRMYTAYTGHIKIQEQYEINRFDLTPRQKAYLALKKTVLFFAFIDSFYRSKANPLPRRLSESDVSKEEFVRRLLARYENNLMTFVNICRFYDIKLIFGKVALHREKYSMYDKGLYFKYYDMVFGLMEKVAKENNIPFVDADAYFSALPDNGKYFIYSGEDWCHLNAEGNKILAGLFAKAIIDNGYIK